MVSWRARIRCCARATGSSCSGRCCWTRKKRVAAGLRLLRRPIPLANDRIWPHRPAAAIERTLPARALSQLLRCGARRRAVLAAIGFDTEVRAQKRASSEFRSVAPPDGRGACLRSYSIERCHPRTASSVMRVAGASKCAAVGRPSAMVRADKERAKSRHRWPAFRRCGWSDDRAIADRTHQRPRCFFLSRARLRPNCLGADLASCSSCEGK